MTRIAIPLAVLLSITLAATTVEAGKVVVLRVAGDPEGELEDGLMSIIEDRHDLVTSGEFERAARKSGIDDLDGKALGKLARKLGADALVEGVVSREEEGFLLVVKIRGKNGKIVKKVSVDLAKPRLSSKAKKRVGTVVLDGIDMVLGIAPDDIEEGDDIEMDEEERPKKKKSRKEKNRGKRSKAKAERDAEELADDEDRPRRGRDDDEDEGEDDFDEDEDDFDDEEDEDDDRVAARDDDEDIDDELGLRDDDDGAPRKRSPHPVARVEVGPSAKMRTLTFTSRAFDQAPLGYESSLVPGARVGGEVYPLALKSDGALSNLGVGFEYDQTLAMTTRSSDAPDVTLPTLQKHWDVGARYRIPFGKKPTSPMVTVGAGLGRRFFIVDRSALPAGAELDMPDVAYKYYHAGAAFRLPIGAKAALHAGARGMMFSSAGSISDTNQYGGAKLTGLDGTVGVDFKITPSVVAGVAGSFTQIGFAFVGNGEETNNRDLDPMTQDVGGASDRYIGLAGTIGYVY